MMSSLSVPTRFAPSRAGGRRLLALVLSGCLFGLGACVETQEEEPTPEDLKVIEKNILSVAPKPQFAVNANIDDKVEYLGLDTSMNPIEPGKDVTLTHYWKVNSAPGAGWRSFTHVNGPSGNESFINFDHGPIGSKYPVHQWKDGQIIRDEHTIRLPPTWAHDKMKVYVGLWRGNERMPVLSGEKDPEGRLLAAAIPVKATVVPPPSAKRYMVSQTPKPPKLDGKLDEPAWKKAPSTGLFVNTLTGAPAAQRTHAKMLWDKKNLYIGIEAADTDIWSNLGKRDDKLWTQEAVEIMIDADGNGKTYVEFQVAPNGTVFDTYLPEWRKWESHLDPKLKDFSWNSKIKASVKVNGTLNKRKDQDKEWVVEIAIPFADVNGMDKGGVKTPPELGTTYRVNLFRMDQPEGQPQQASAWSPPMVGDFHALAKFGEIVFANEEGQVPPPPTAAKPGEERQAAVKEALSGLGAGSPEEGLAKKRKAAGRKKRPAP